MFRFDLCEDTLIILPNSGMNLITACNFYKEVIDLVSRTNSRYLLVNMTHIPILQSLDFGILGALHKYMQSRSGDMAICSCRKGVIDSWKLSGMTEDIAMFESPNQFLRILLSAA
ncbi:MAG: STAS domain-containing protein [Pseudanabaenaceae cyanobacterium bins.39]|nr:STAS domain-containing protein [Pseudanabaenaceae cyanobacterium bins.39]